MATPHNNFDFLGDSSIVTFLAYILSGMDYFNSLLSKLTSSNSTCSNHVCCFSVVSDSLQLHGLQHARLLCPSAFLLPSLFPNIRVFPNESALHIRWPKDWSFSFCISPSSEYSGLISLRIIVEQFPLGLLLAV